MPLVLVIEDEKILAESVCFVLERYGYATAKAPSGEEGLRRAEEASPDVAIVDIRLPGIDGLEVLRRLRDVTPATEVVMMTAHASVASAVEAMRCGAFDYLSKPVDLDELRVVVDKALAHQRLNRELSFLKARDQIAADISGIVGDSAPTRRLREQVAHVASLALPDGGGPTVLLLGETGTGKGLVARAIHYGSPGARGPFVDVNCAALPSSLLEAELFGYERGAFTDAKRAKPGLFEAAEGGTLFLDEIGHMDPGLQVKLLKAIEDKAIRRLGGLRTTMVRTRIISATNRNLSAAVAEGAFRQDLYFRIKVLAIDIPPLRARTDDILSLARHFLATFARQYGRPEKTLTPEAESLLLTYAWPGNVRELAHVMERAVLIPTGPTLNAEDLGLRAGPPPPPILVEAGGRVTVDFSAGGIRLDEIERELIVRALEACGGNRTQAARLLGISRDTLRYRLEKYQLEASPPAP